MRIDRSTARYEAWLKERIPLITEDLDLKHQWMKIGPFPFLRATFYRWAETWPQVCPELAKAPVLLGIGDLHIENFGTWRDAEGRLAWGINDFDEACWIPYTCDLVRLATSAHLAIAGDHLKFSPEKTCDSILKGYMDALEAGGGPYVLADRHHALREMARERLKDPEKFWEKLRSLPVLHEAPPSGAMKALRRLLPDRDVECAIVHRVSGMGSLGRRRYVALADWHGGAIAREAKELTTSAWLWARPHAGSATAEVGGPEILYQEIMNRSIRCPDPFVLLRGKWIGRRLAPDCSRITLESLGEKQDGYHLLHAMGWETANVHLGSASVKALWADLRARAPHWLHHSAEAMVHSVNSDWQDWCDGIQVEKSYTAL